MPDFFFFYLSTLYPHFCYSIRQVKSDSYTGFLKSVIEEPTFILHYREWSQVRKRKGFLLDAKSSIYKNQQTLFFTKISTFFDLKFRIHTSCNLKIIEMTIKIKCTVLLLNLFFSLQFNSKLNLHLLFKPAKS